MWQPTPRRILPWTLLQNTRPLHSLFENARMRLSGDLVARVARPGIWINSKLNSSNDAMVRSELAALPERLDRVDALIADGVPRYPGEIPAVFPPTAVPAPLAPAGRARLAWRSR